MMISFRLFGEDIFIGRKSDDNVNKVINPEEACSSNSNDTITTIKLFGKDIYVGRKSQEACSSNSTNATIITNNSLIIHEENQERVRKRGRSSEQGHNKSSKVPKKQKNHDNVNKVIIPEKACSSSNATTNNNSLIIHEENQEKEACSSSNATNTNNSHIIHQENKACSSSNATNTLIIRQENQERVLKRGRSSEQGHNKSSRVPKKQKNPGPSKEEKKKAKFKPPNLPSELVEKAMGMGGGRGEVPKLVMQKYITASDVKRQQNRLLLTKTDMREHNGLVLTDEEKRELKEGGDIKVTLILQNKEEMELNLSMWPKNTDEKKTLVLQSCWWDVTNKINLKHGDVAQLWSFRFGQERKIAFVFLQVVNDNNQLNNAVTIA
ncbi:uncharacterized protein LOC110732597 [Chenopodium quinoa]|uniref:uncharacterized protein LOC110732597 n=1 Tax=Chenopodium quinoa TaxID=63459 RepID=UPI000B77F7DA|nr:uncharacterized protein LOC110732597 [Chenopodium quinoa]